MRKVIKKFHTYVFATEPGGIAHGADDGEISSDEAREGLLAELATFQMMLQKSALVCQAEARQVVEYEKEKERIGAFLFACYHYARVFNVILRSQPRNMT